MLGTESAIIFNRRLFATHFLVGMLTVGSLTLGMVMAAVAESSAQGSKPNHNSEKILNIYNWADYIDPQILLDFEKEFGIEVNYDIYDASEVVDIKLMTGRSGYDVVIHSASGSSRLHPVGIYHPIDYSRLSNWHHIDQQLVSMIKQHYSNGMQGVPYMWGTTGVTYNVEMIKQRMANAPVDSARLIFDPKIISKFADCGVSFLDDPQTVVALAMIYLGYPANSVDKQHLQEAETLLKAVRPYIKYFSSTKMLLDLPSEEVCIAMSWSGDYSIASSRAAAAGVDIDLAYSIPQEGSILWVDNVYIPSDAPHQENAYLFIDYLLRPQVIAAASNYIGYANANRSATPYVDPEMTGDIAIYPDPETLELLQTTEVLVPKLERLRSRTWTRVKTGL